MNQSISRRSILRSALFGASAAALGGPFLAACGSSDSGSNSGSGDGSSAGSGPVDLPSYRPARYVEPDLPGSADGVQDGYLRFPAQLQRSAEDLPTGWNTLTSLVLTYDPPPPAAGDNAYWTAVNERIGGELAPTIVPQADYREKFNAVMAGNDIPHTVLLTGDQLTMPRLPDLLGARFADLSEYLSGDAVEAYPNLANIPTYAWRGARVDGRLWGVPVEQQVLTNVMMARVDLLSSIGVAPADVKTTDDFTDLCAELTAPSSGRWAMGPFGPTMMLLFWAAFGVPNNWRQEPDGTLTKDWETDEYFAAVEYHLELSKQGYFHPDFTGYTVTQAKQAFSSGTTALYMDGLAAWRGFVEQERRSVDEIGVMLPFALPGADPVFHVASGIFGITALRQDDPAVVQDRLRLLDFLAAPFGTEEWFLLNYGVEGVDHEMTSGLPVLTDKGIEEIRTMFKFIGAPPGVMFSGQSPQWVEAQHAWESAVIPATIPDPTVGVYIEPVEDTTGALQAVYDAVADVTAERISIDDFRAVTENWTEKIGNETRERLQEALG